jgi:cell volume regulation protein A
LNNYSLFFRGKLKRLAKPLSVRRILVDFRLVTIESAFIVRTFFFVVFGATIVLSDLVSLKVFIQSFLIIAVIYMLRWLLFRIIVGKDIRPQIFIAPRGLITILLFFAIPPARQLMTFENGVLLYVIIVSSILMTWSLVSDKKRAFYDDSIFDPDPGILGSRFMEDGTSESSSSIEEKPE